MKFCVVGTLQSSSSSSSCYTNPCSATKQQRSLTHWMVAAASIISAILFIPLCFQLTLQRTGSMVLRYSSPKLRLQQAAKPQKTTKVSLWLLLPYQVHDAYQAEIDRLATLQPESSGIPFVPHITLVGGVTVAVDKDKDMDALIRTLQVGLQKDKTVGPVPCTLNPEVVFETNSTTQEPIWNQAAVMTMQPASPEFLHLCRVARQLLGLPDADDCLFPAPVHQAHLSLYYGREGVPTAADVNDALPLNFTATRVALWETTPSASEQDVPAWRELAAWDL